jgi:hypothetical protein
MELLLRLVVVAAVVWACWSAFQPSCTFIVRIIDGMPRTVKGTVTAAFLEEVRRICHDHGVRNGAVRGIVNRNRISLAFSGGIPPAGQQQLRNWWAISGWSNRPRAARR